MEPGRITAEGGSVLITGTGANTAQRAYAIYVREDTVIAVLAGGDSSTSTGTNFLPAQGLSGKTLKQGDWYYTPANNFFNSITLTSGSIIIYKQPA